MSSQDATAASAMPRVRTRRVLPRVLAGGLGSMAAHLALFAILLVSLTAGLVGTLSYTRARRALEGEARSRLALLARNVAEHLHRELEDRAADTTNWAQLEVMRALLYHDVDKELAQFMRQIVSGGRIYRTIAAMDAGGAVIASAGIAPSALATLPPLGTRLAVVPQADGAFSWALRLDTAIPNPDQPGNSIGTLVVLLDQERLLDAMQASVEPGGARPSLTVRRAGGDVVFGAGVAPVSDDPAFLTGMAPVGALPDVDGPALEVVVAEPVSAALAAVTALRATLVKVALLVLLVSSVLGALVAWRISAPIRRLTSTVRGVTARGQLDAGVEFPRAAGEIGVLAAAFRTMLESLTAAQADALTQSRRAFLGDIAANIAHEVRTPLSVLKTSAQLLARQQLPAAEQRRLAENVTAEVDRLNRVVTNLVDLARPEPVRYRDQSLVEIVEKAAVFFAPQATRLGVAISVEPTDGTPRVHGSADQLHQVLLNVMHNALQAMDGPGNLRIGCRVENGWSVLDVRDTGPGFSPEVLARAFSPFCSTKQGGSGLGLAISRRIVEEHGGTIVAENQPTGGARVRIRLPRLPVTT